LTSTDLHGLPGFQLSLHFALVGWSSLDVLPLADEVLSLRSEGERLRFLREGDVVWHNVGPRHHLCLGSAHGFDTPMQAQEFFATQVKALAEDAARVEGKLMPTGMHPWFHAERAETWPHGGAERDLALHTLFGADRHGWANQQGLDLAIPFASEAEFKPLYAALRFLQPLLPVLSAASPIAEGAIGPARQCRLAARHDFVCSHPEFALTSVQRYVPPALESLAAFESLVAAPLKAALVEQGHSATLLPSQVSAGGLWPDRRAEHIAIRMLDGQECVSANIAVVAAVQALVNQLSYDSSVPSAELDVWPAARLDELTTNAIVEGESAIIRDADYLRAWGFPEGYRCRSQELLQFLWEEKLAPRFDEALAPFLETIVMEGPLASRIVQALPPRWDDEALFNVYRNVVACLGEDASFRP
tara:strand:- start:20939 stop:22189 length:1251 start_codon:yes stop_codon:yes gene_type:complete